MKIYALGLLGAMALVGAMLVPAESVDARLSVNGLKPVPARITVNGVAATTSPQRLAVNGVATTKTGLDWSAIGKQALGK